MRFSVSFLLNDDDQCTSSWPVVTSKCVYLAFWPCASCVRAKITHGLIFTLSCSLLLCLFCFFCRCLTHNWRYFFYAFISVAFWLCLFARSGARFDLGTLLWLCLLLASAISWSLPFPSVFFLFVAIFYGSKVVLCSCRFVAVFLAALFRSCCRGFLSLFALLVLLFMLNNAFLGYCVFLLQYACCFCFRFGPVGGAAFFASVSLRRHASPHMPPRDLSCTPTPNFLLPPHHTTPMHQTNPCVPIWAPFERSHALMHVIVLVRVLAFLFVLLCVCVHSCLSLLMRMCLCFMFIGAHVLALCA